MPHSKSLIELLNHEKVKELLYKLYGEDNHTLNEQILRYKKLIRKYLQHFPDEDIVLFSTPGRTEICGNHTDHNSGIVLAASVDVDMIAASAKTNNSIVTLYSEGFSKPFVVDLSNIEQLNCENGTTSALIRGIASRLKALGYRIGGFNAFVVSNIGIGSGLSSSASIEVLIAYIFNLLYNGGNIDRMILAKVSRYAENEYFRKPCGLMDQIACAIGGIVTIDFKNQENPRVKKINFDLSKKGYSLLVAATGESHADLTDEYASVPLEMKAVANTFGKELLRDINIAMLLNKISYLREKVGDRAILRAIHYFYENQRVLKEVVALENDDFDRFLDIVNESGSSSMRWLQNCFSTKNPYNQGITLSLALTEDFLKDKAKGACRVHGGGFAGTIQVFLKNDLIEEYKTFIENVFGEKSVTLLKIRPYGAVNVG